METLHAKAIKTHILTLNSHKLYERTLCSAEMYTVYVCTNALVKNKNKEIIIVLVSE